MVEYKYYLGNKVSEGKASKMDIARNEKAYLENAVKLMSSLQSYELELEDLCRILTLDTFKYLSARITYIAKLNNNATVSVLTSFGESENIENFQFLPLSTHTPTTKAIISNEIVWIPNKEKLDEEFPLVNATKRRAYESMYVVPIRKFDSPIGAFAVVGENLPMNDVIRADLELLALMIATRFSNKGDYIESLPTIATKKVHLETLTPREVLIQKHMKNGLTNAQIALELGYSESLIRQAAVTLFAKLGVSNRVEAGKLFKEEENV